MELQNYSPDKIDALLTTYEGFTKDLGIFKEITIRWAGAPARGCPYELDILFCECALPEVAADWFLMEKEEQSHHHLIRLLTIFRWGTPLSQSAQLVRIETAATSLNQLAQALPVLA